MYMLVAYGPNSIAVPCMFFETLEAGKVKIAELVVFGGVRPTKEGHGFVVADELPGGIADAVFTSYYDGCGGVSGFELEEVKFGVPVVPFNLD